MEQHIERIKRFYTKHNRMPSYAELAAVLGYRSKSAVAYTVNKLIAQGAIAKDKTGRLLPGRFQAGARMLGLVEAGFPSPAEEELIDVMDFDEYLTPNKETSYVLRVKGDSMIDAGIREGDLVIVERRSTYAPGQIVVAAVDGAYTLKYLRKARTGYYLEPANRAYKPIFPKEGLSIEAVVTAVVRKY